jgi:hypothetical protein
MIVASRAGAPLLQLGLDSLVRALWRRASSDIRFNIALFDGVLIDDPRTTFEEIQSIIERHQSMDLTEFFAFAEDVFDVTDLKVVESSSVGDEAWVVTADFEIDDSSFVRFSSSSEREEEVRSFLAAQGFTIEDTTT